MTLVKVNNPMSKSLDGFVNDLFKDFPTALGKSLREDVLHYPPVNILDTPDAYMVSLAAPGLEKADFKISLDANILSISAEKKLNTLDDKHKMLRTEFGQRAFKRSFTLDDKIASEEISAKYENGILHLELPKREIAKAVSKEISVS